jgi:hypothetical protein
MVDTNFGDDVNRFANSNCLFTDRDFICHVNTLMQLDY